MNEFQMKERKEETEKNEEEKYHNDIMIIVAVVVVVVVIEVRIKGSNKVEFMAPKGSETRTSLTSFFCLTLT